MQTSESQVTSSDSKELTPTPSDACTSACTSEPENVNAVPSKRESDQDDNTNRHQSEGEETSGIDQGDRLAAIAVAIADLSPTDRAKLAAMITGHEAEKKPKRGNSQGVTQ